MVEESSNLRRLEGREDDDRLEHDGFRLRGPECTNRMLVRWAHSCLELGTAWKSRTAIITGSISLRRLVGREGARQHEVSHPDARRFRGFMATSCTKSFGSSITIGISRWATAWTSFRWTRSVVVESLLLLGSARDLPSTMHLLSFRKTWCIGMDLD